MDMRTVTGLTNLDVKDAMKVISALELAIQRITENRSRIISLESKIQAMDEIISSLEGK